MMHSSKNYTAPRIEAIFALAYHPDMDLKVRQIRTTMGWSQQELADRAGLRQATISKVESRPDKTELGTLVKIAAAFGVSVGDLIEGMPSDPALNALANRFLRLPAEDRLAITRQVEALADRSETAA